MAAGLSSAIDRICAIIENCDPSTNWGRSHQRLSTLLGKETIPSGIDKKYFIHMRIRDERPVVTGSHVTTINKIELELARYYGGGELHSSEYYGLSKQLESQADIVEQCLLYSNNWDSVNTGIWLIYMDGSEQTSQKLGSNIMLRVLDFTVTIRQPKTFVQV